MRVRKGNELQPKSFTDLEAWQSAHAFVLDVYRLTAALPIEERFGLSTLFRGAAISMAANIAEGFRKYAASDKARFLNNAEGSLEECRYYCILIRDLGYADTDQQEEALNVIADKLASYLRRLREK